MARRKKQRDSPRATTNITGVAGEYFVAGELSRHGWIATLTLKNTPNIDVIAATLDGLRTVNIQVKTRSIGNRQGWILSKGIEQLVSGKNFYIVFVDLMGLDQRPDYYIIPKNLFARWIALGHQRWLRTPGRGGRRHIDNPIRGFNRRDFQEFEAYHNNWGALLG